MKIIGLIGDAEFVATITREEIKKIFNKNYTDRDFEKIKIGDVINVSEGYCFRDDIRYAANKIKEATDAYDKVHGTFQKFANLVISKTQPE